jgi:hypothetical protein
MATLETQFEWLKEVLAEKPLRFADYYKEDIANHLDIDSIDSADIKELFNRKFVAFNKCETKEEVQEFVDKITGHIVMTAQIEEIIADYLA